MAGVIDFRAFVPLPQCMKAFMTPPLDKYAEKYHLSPDDVKMAPKELVARLDSCGIDHMVLSGPGMTNEDVADYVQSQPGRLSGIASISPSSGLSEAVREVRRSHSLGLRLVSLRPLLDGFRASDKRYYPVYAACAELGMAAVIHTSFNFGRGLKLDFGRPLHLDEVAIDFPELTIVASHGGWPWVSELVAVAWHNENVYIEVSAHRAKHMAKEGSGWDSLFNYGSGPIKSRLLWGSTSPVMDLERQLSETRELPLSEQALSNMFDANPRELLARLGVEVTSFTSA